jgi:hypothetical protein
LTKNGNLLRIELNADAIHSADDLRRVFEQVLRMSAATKAALKSMATMPR